MTASMVFPLSGRRRRAAVLRFGAILFALASTCSAGAGPTLGYSTYFGGAGYDAIYAVATDSAGNIYITGETSSWALPGAQGGRLGVKSSRNAFVSKLSPDGLTVM